MSEQIAKILKRKLDDLAGCDLGDHHGAPNHVGRAPFTVRTSRHTDSFSTLSHHGSATEILENSKHKKTTYGVASREWEAWPLAPVARPPHFTKAGGPPYPCEPARQSPMQGPPRVGA